MIALPVRAPVPLSFVGFGRVIFFLTTFFEVIVDAQRQAAAAHKRYPFAEW
ncbi:MAG: hypothetical protein WB504_15290 [Pseudolabrys sp.]|jgi:hypothetical protein